MHLAKAKQQQDDLAQLAMKYPEEVNATKLKDNCLFLKKKSLLFQMELMTSRDQLERLGISGERMSGDSNMRALYFRRIIFGLCDQCKLSVRVCVSREDARCAEQTTHALCSGHAKILET